VQEINNHTSLDNSLFLRIKKLIDTSNQRPLLFMKGTPDAPRCGYSRQVIEMFQANNITDYDTFDILDENQQDIRSGVKEYSDWPT